MTSTQLGHPPAQLAFHVDDVGCSHASNVAMEEVWDAGLVMSGSTIVPSGWFAETAALCRRRPDLDMGVHLALTSESAAFRWRPLTSIPGLADEDGFMWTTVDEVRVNVSAEAADVELRRQLDTALDAGITVTHLDHHMGAALVPELAEVTVSIAVEYEIPTLFPADVAGYVNDVNWDDSDLSALHHARARLEDAGLAFADRFWMGLSYRDEECPVVFRRLVSEAEPGFTYVSLHCAARGDIEAVHPRDAWWRVGEYRLFTERTFVEWVGGQAVELLGMRELSG